MLAPASAPLITLTFLDFATECQYDFFFVYDGPSTSDPLLAAFNGDIEAQPVTATSGAVSGDCLQQIFNCGLIRYLLEERSWLALEALFFLFFSLSFY